VTILGGHVSMAAGLVGNQWNEGDVSDSVVRRVVLPDAFFTLDGLLETALTVLDEFAVFEDMVDRELKRQLPFLATTALLMEAVRSGIGRETAHRRIQEHALASAASLRAGETEVSDLFDRVLADPELQLDPRRIEAIAASPVAFTGRTVAQIQAVVGRVSAIVAAHPEAAAYSPARIL
ncbi:MAG: adenylosuccinate lyase, partial [Acidimicrobiia bacterium]